MKYFVHLGHPNVIASSVSNKALLAFHNVDSKGNANKMKYLVTYYKDIL